LDDCHPGSDVDFIVWEKAEELIGMAKKSDVFLIFDCCHAGKVTVPEFRQPFTTRNFEYIAASDSLTRRPGKHSFTAALIHALEHLSHDPDGFTTQRLWRAIRQAPNFPKGQVPVLDERHGYCSRRLLLGPLSADEVEKSPTIENQNHKLNARFDLCLQLMFDDLPSTSQMITFCRSLKAMINSKELCATQVNWKGMHRSGETEAMEDAHASAYFIGKYWRAKARRTKSIGDGKRTTGSKRTRADSSAASPRDGILQLPEMCESPTEGRNSAKRPCNMHS
jgi:hypothetical protein